MKTNPQHQMSAWQREVTLITVNVDIEKTQGQAIIAFLFSFEEANNQFIYRAAAIVYISHFLTDTLAVQCNALQLMFCF